MKFLFYKIVLIIFITASVDSFSEPLVLNNYFNLTSNDITYELESAVSIVREESKYDSISILKGNYIVNKTIKISEDIIIDGGGSEIVFNRGLENDLIIFDMASNSELKNIFLNASYNARIGILIDNETNITLEALTLYNFIGDNDQPAQAIRVVNKSSNIILNKINVFNILAYENGISGDTIGANRGIYFGEVYNSTIENCVVHDVHGYEDGDAIHIQASQDVQLNTVIDGCLIYNFGKRGIKIQASGVSVSNNNIISDDLNFLSKTDENHSVAGVHSGITINGNSNKVLNNSIFLKNAFTLIDVFSSSHVYVGHNIGGVLYTLDDRDSVPKIRNSYIRAAYLNNVTNSDFIANKFYSSYGGIHLRNSSGNRIDFNLIGYNQYRNSSANQIYYEENSSNNIFQNNSGFNSTGFEP